MPVALPLASLAALSQDNSYYEPSNPALVGSVIQLRDAHEDARQLLDVVALETGDEGIALSGITVLELAHDIPRAA
jgi:hypothetical protein